ncbi:MAG: hypothetical protein JW864_06035 [Spirochaetes bacterium]|nr:hypothetical protein [Spirochaetota bacterium]
MLMYSRYLILLLLISLMSCSANIKAEDCTFKYSVKINNNINIDKIKFSNILSSLLKQNRTSRIYVEIVVFGYSSGKEEYVYSGINDENIPAKINPASLEVLLKIKCKNKRGKALFINTSGNTLEENVRVLAGKIKKELCE